MKLRFTAGGFLIGILVGILVSFFFPEVLSYGLLPTQGIQEASGRINTYSVKGGGIFASSVVFVPFISGFLFAFLGFLIALFLPAKKRR